MTSSYPRSIGFEVYPSDMRLRVPATGLYTYADVTVVCGEPEFEDAELDVLLNPTLLVEVLSKSTEDYDRGAKFDHYRTVPSLREVLFLGQHEVHVLHYLRQDDGTWILSETRRLASFGFAYVPPWREVQNGIELSGGLPSAQASGWAANRQPFASWRLVGKSSCDLRPSNGDVRRQGE